MLSPSNRLRWPAALLGLIFILSSLTGCNMSNLPRNMNLKAFDPHRAEFTCKYEIDVAPPITKEAEASFQEGMNVTTYALMPNERQYTKAVELWSRAMDQGHWKAAMNLAGLYEAGLGVQQDSEQAVLILEKLMKHGVPAAFDKMGTYHQRGIGVKSDTSRAYAFWQLAAEMGNPAAQAFLGQKLNATYDNPGQGFWGNLPLAMKLLECSFAQGNGDAAHELAASLTIDKDYKRALKIYHEGVKLGSKDCARDLSVSFRTTEPLTDHLIDRDRSTRYRELRAALELNPDLRLPNLDKVLPLPPAELPMWDGKRETLVNAAKALVPLPPVQPTPGAKRTGRAYIPQGYVLQAQAYPQSYEASAPALFTGYWLPKLLRIVREHEADWEAAQVPLYYKKGETFDTIDRSSMGIYARNATRTVWEYLGEAVAVAAPPVHPRVAQGIARASHVPNPLQYCKGMRPCPRTGIWFGSVIEKHPLAGLYNRWDRFAYLARNQPFPDPKEQHIAIAPHEVNWTWVDNANQIGPEGLASVTLSDVHEA